MKSNDLQPTSKKKKHTHEAPCNVCKKIVKLPDGFSTNGAIMAVTSMKISETIKIAEPINVFTRPITTYHFLCVKTLVDAAIVTHKSLTKTPA